MVVKCPAQGESWRGVLFQGENKTFRVLAVGFTAKPRKVSSKWRRDFMMSNELSQQQQRGELLVAIVQRPLDLTYARDHHWYRIPVDSVEKFLKRRWPPRWLALYQPSLLDHKNSSPELDLDEAQIWKDSVGD